MAHLDETRGRQGAVTSLVSGWVRRLSRGGPVARALVGEGFAGMLGPDRYRADPWDPGRWRPRCWAHVLRDVAAIRERGGAGEESGDAWLAQGHQMLPWGPRVRAGTGTVKRSTWHSAMTPRRREVARLLAVGSPCAVATTAGTCQEICTRRAAWRTCVPVDGVAPTHHTAESALRPGVLWRTGSVGTQRGEGARFVARMRTVRATLQPPQRHGLESLTAAHEAALRGEAAPSLLPKSDQKSQAAA